MALSLSELLSHLPEHERAPFLRLPTANRNDLRSFIMESTRLPRCADDLFCAPGTVSGPAIGRTRECDRGRVELLPIEG